MVAELRKTSVLIIISYWLSFKHISLNVSVNTRKKGLFEVEVINLTSLSVESLYGLSGR